MKNKKILIMSIIVIVIIISIFLMKNNYNFSKIGNNISNKSAEQIKEYILNIESYQANATIKIKSNKNENTYQVNQKYHKEKNIYIQEVLEPVDIAGMQIIYDGEVLKIENTKLNLSKIYENYNYIGSNELSLSAFIEDYSQDEQAKYTEKDGKIILETKVRNGSKYITSKKLYINREEGKIEKIEINDITQNTKIYILYNEIEINTLQKEEILAFSLKTFEENI